MNKQNSNTQQRTFYTTRMPRCTSLPAPLVLAGGALLFSLCANLQATSFQPPANRTGAPPQNATCAECHISQGNGSLTVEFSGDALTYVPNGLYDLRVILQDQGQQRFGFSMTSRFSDMPTMAVGEWHAGSDSGVYDNGQHIGHRNAPFDNGAHTFEVSWIAPASNVGDIIFYLAGNAANGNFINGVGDHIYTQTLTISPASSRSFWGNSVRTDTGWRYTGEAYPGLAGIGWVWDDYWPWVVTFAQGDPNIAEWVWISPDGSSSGFWGYNANGNYWFWADATTGWYYIFDSANPGWMPYNL